MSSVLNRKRKKMQPLGYSKQELIGLQDYARRQSNTNYLIEESYMNIRLIAYQILHDKFGFGQKRIIRVEETIDKYLNAVSDGGMSTNQLQFFMKSKCGIDVKAESNKVPSRERLYLIEKRIAPASIQSARTYIGASICNYFSLIGVCLKTQFNFSANKILEVYEWVRYYINTLSRVREFDLRLRDIAGCLMEEVKYCDSRYVAA